VNMGYLTGDDCERKEAEHADWHCERHTLGWCTCYNGAPSGGVVESEACRREDGQGSAKHVCWFSAGLVDEKQ
jgi:hypothetical protein